MKYEAIRKTVLEAILEAVEKGLINGTSGNIAMRDSEAVSYTHLDVYKRQGLCKLC